MTPADPYFHRTVALRADRRRLELVTSQELFSSHQVDRGSRLLLRVVADVVGDALDGASVLDLGCGYGPLGLGLRAMGSGPATLVDRDALAVRYAAKNAEANQLDAVDTYGSLGYDGVAGRFGVVVSNIPGHASPAVVRHFVEGAACVLVPGGLAAFVVVSALGEQVEGALAAAGATVERNVEDRGHTVWVARFATADAADPAPAGLGVYRRGEVDIEVDGEHWTAETAEGVPEFERLSYHTAALMRHLASEERAESIAVWNPGPGHLSIYLARRLRPRLLVLADRDLLALRYSEANLTRNDVGPARVTLVHDVDLGAWAEPRFDLIVDVLRRSEPPGAAAERIDHARSLLTTDGALVAAGPAVRVQRVATLLASRGTRARRIEGRRAALLRVSR